MLIETTIETAQVCDQLMAALGNDTLSAARLMERLKISHRPTFRMNYLDLALAKKLIELTVHDKPNSRN